MIIILDAEKAFDKLQHTFILDILERSRPIPKHNKSMYTTLRSRIDKWDLIKLESFCTAKDIDNRTNKKPVDWEKVFTNPTCKEG